MQSFLTADNLQDSPGIRHGFFTRAGGTSTGIYKGLNCGLGSNDRRDFVLENRRRALEFLSCDLQNLSGLYQIHSNQVIELKQPWGFDDQPQADALVTTTPGVALAILTADCGPILFADSKNKVIGAAHAGWKGASNSILENTITTMLDLGAERQHIKAAIGPTIAQKSYEVGPELFANLADSDSSNKDFFIPSTNKNHHMFDLPGYIHRQLKESNIADVFDTAQDTYTQSDLFYSYRRTTHHKEADYGRQISMIGLIP